MFKQLGPNQTQITRGPWLFLVSYETPVAVTDSRGTIYRTKESHSNTTSRHINDWIDSLGSGTIVMCDQDRINEAFLHGKI